MVNRSILKKEPMLQAYIQLVVEEIQPLNTKSFTHRHHGRLTCGSAFNLSL